MLSLILSTYKRFTEPNTNRFDLKKFVPKRVIKAELHTLIIVGHFADSPDVKTVIKYEKDPFSKTEILNIASAVALLEQYQQNAEFSRHMAYFDLSTVLGKQISGVNVEIVHPASDMLIAKHTQSDSVVIAETPEFYEKYTKPYVQSMGTDHLEWLYNVLDKKSETERILHERENDAQGTGFLLLHDYKVKDITNPDTLYLNALCHRRDITSLRDLRGEHLPLLRAIYNEGLEAVEQKLGIPRSRVRVFVHYQPTFYHFHAHFVSVTQFFDHMKYLRSRSLLEIIKNLESDSDYYAKATLEYEIRETNGIWKAVQNDQR